MKFFIFGYRFNVVEFDSDCIMYLHWQKLLCQSLVYIWILGLCKVSLFSFGSFSCDKLILTNFGWSVFPSKLVCCPFTIQIISFFFLTVDGIIVCPK